MFRGVFAVDGEFVSDAVLLRNKEEISDMAIKKTALLLAALSLSGGYVAHAAPAKPNIVLIFIDDMGYADIGPFGNTTLRTPHLDRMAQEGRRFTSFYATSVCTMSRACMMTGCYNTRLSLPGVLTPESPIGLNPDEVIMPEVMKPHGYATACIGKWHLGDKPEFMPNRQGFDFYFGLPYSNNMVSRKPTAVRKGLPPLPLYRNETVIETEPDQSLLTKRYTEEAIQFIREHKDGPFFLYLPHSMIHEPLAASADFKGKSAEGLLGDAIEEIDWSVGQIMATLKELKLDENTLVIFTSDNGPDLHPAPPFRGLKATCFEGGLRVPCIMRWPGKIPAGTSCDQITGNIDMLPTFAKLVGQPLDPKRILDGRDVSTLLFDKNPAPVRDSYVHYSGGQSQLIAYRRGEWKLFLSSPGDSSLDTYNPYKYRPKQTDVYLKQREGAGPGLFNLATDPGETTDVAAKHPEIVKQLLEEAKQYDAEIAKNKRPCGGTPPDMKPLAKGKN